MLKISKIASKTSRGKILQMVTLVALSLLILNWYLFRNEIKWNYNINSENFINNTESPSICPKLSLQFNVRATYGLCKPHRPSQTSCRFLQEIYGIKPELLECKEKGAGDVCMMKMTRTKKSSKISFTCSQTLCRQGKSDSFKVLTVDPRTGLATIVNEFHSVRTLERGLPNIVKRNKQNKLNFVFIECTSHQGKGVSQLLAVDPDFTIKKTETVRNKNHINVVVLLIDSISRAHFYRSLPKTIATFQNWRENPGSVPANVYDFELFQALHGHTAENTQALFTGNVFPIELIGTMPPVNISAMFEHYDRAGYHTMYQEDLCWKGIWGLMVDLGVRRWSDLQDKMKNTFIDHTGLTHSSCKILSSLGVTTPFNGPYGDQICYNGKFQHSYFLRYTTDTLHAINKSRNACPLFSYTSLSVAHDHRSIRTQTLDVGLENYVRAMAKEQNTLTVILADHGNTYTRYTAKLLEGRFEMYHPSLFMIVPDRVASLLGKKAISALGENQRRLVTMMDLHRSLMVLVNPLSGNVKPVGLFTPIAVDRTCDDLELRLPNLCVCEGWDVPADNDSSRIPIAEFAIGQLNSRLAEQIQNIYERSCQRLQPLWFENTRERNSKVDRSLITSMDIRVKAGDVALQREDIFHVEVMTREIFGENSLKMTLISFDRLTLFGKYADCADNGVDLKLCVCSQTAKQKKSIGAFSSEDWVHFGQRPVVRKLHNTTCLVLITRAFAKNKSNAYEVANLCRGQTYRVKLYVEQVTNMKFSCEVPLTLTVTPGNVLFAFSVRKHVSYWDANIKVSTEVEKN